MALERSLSRSGRFGDKSVPKSSPATSVPQEWPSRQPQKNVCDNSVSPKSVLQECPTTVPQECPAKVPYESALQECPRRLSHKSGLRPGLGVPHQIAPEKRSTRVAHKSVKQCLVVCLNCLFSSMCAHSGSWLPSCYSYRNRKVFA